MSGQTILLLLLILTLAIPGLSQSKDNDYSEMDLSELVNLDIYASSVLTAHIHNRGDWMLDYSYMSMSMDGMRGGTRSSATSEVLESYMVSPLNMMMDMHMLMAMYAPSNELTLMFMLNVIDKEMELETRAGNVFTTKSSGLGDITASVNYAIGKSDTHFGELEYSATVGISFPTGSIDEEDFVMAMNQNVQLPYPMQLGSGTYDVIVGGAYTFFSPNWYWGGQVLLTLRTQENKNHYRLGNRTDLKLWINRSLGDSLSVNLRIDAYSLDNIHGQDEDLNPMMSPTADPNSAAKQVANASLGLDLYLPGTQSNEYRMGFSFGKPIYQDFDGLQLETDQIIKINVQALF